LAWFAGRWRNHQPKRAEKPHLNSSGHKALDGPATRPMTPLAVENSVGKPAAPVAPNVGMGKREWRTPIPHFVPVGPQGPAGTIVLTGLRSVLVSPRFRKGGEPLRREPGRKVRTPQGAMPRNSDSVARYTRAARREACRRTVPQKIKPPAIPVRREAGKGEKVR